MGILNNDVLMQEIRAEQEQRQRQVWIRNMPRKIQNLKHSNQIMLDLINQIEQNKNLNDDVIRDIDVINNDIEKLNALNDDFANYINNREVMQDSLNKKDAQELFDRLIAIQVSCNKLNGILNDMQRGLKQPVNGWNDFSMNCERLNTNTLLLESRLKALKIQLELAEKNNEIVNKDAEERAMLRNVGDNLEGAWRRLY